MTNQSKTQTEVATPVKEATQLGETAVSVQSTALTVINKLAYKQLISIENLEQGLARTKSGAAAGIDGETKAQITSKRIAKLHAELANQTYSPSPAKRISIPKAEGGVRFLGIASQIDKVVQGALLQQLEPLLEPVFLDSSYGFRPGRGCHDALKAIKYKWKDAVWVIKIDIKACFDKINHPMLLNKLSEFCDQATVELIRKLLKAGYVDIHHLSSRSEYSTEGIPQGSLISPLLCNLYLHELDNFVEQQLYPSYNRGKKRPNDPKYAKRYQKTDLDKQVLSEYPELKDALNRVKHNRFVLSTNAATDAFDPGFRRLHYVRYADDFMLGFIGPRKEAIAIRSAIEAKLDQMKLSVNADKSKIYHSSENGIKYLGVYISWFAQNKIKITDNSLIADDVKKQVNSLKAQAITAAHFRVPVEDILNRLVDRKVAKRRKDGTIRGTAWLQLCQLADDKIVQRFSAIIRGLLNYYSCVNHRSDLWKIFAVLRKSCALTLGHKHKMFSAARVYARFGSDLKIHNVVGQVVSTLGYPKSLKTRIDFKTGSRSKQTVYAEQLELELEKIPGSLNTNARHAEVCEYEGCSEIKNLELHHLNPMGNLSKRKDLSAFEKAMIQKQRKGVVLCKKHHNLVHKKGLLSHVRKAEKKQSSISNNVVSGEQPR